VGSTFNAGSNGVITATVVGGGHSMFSYGSRIEQQVTQAQPLTINITSPATLTTVGSTPQVINGTVSDSTATVTVNGVQVANNNGAFQAKVPLVQGSNSIAARALDSKGNDVTDIISLSLDTTPPYITVSSPLDGSVVNTSTVNVIGLINDIVRGTVSQNQASVTVNGVAASISNRSYQAQNVPLSAGLNSLVIIAADDLGNTSSMTINITYLPLQSQRIIVHAGQGQSAAIKSNLAQPIQAQLLDSSAKPVANKPVVFRVTQGDGVLGVGGSAPGQGVLVVTDNNGIASTTFQLGTRAGVGNQVVRATAVGFDGEAVFNETANVGTPAKVTVNSGNNQRGGVGQPLPEPLVVAVIDAGANVVPNAPVVFTVTQGSGQLQNGQTSFLVKTDSDGRAAAELTLGSITGLDAQRVTATLQGSTLYSGFTESALAVGTAGNTTISGVVLDNQDHPLPGVTIRCDGTTSEAISDVNGQFTITSAPVGAVHLIADGSTTSVAGEWPTLALNIVTVAGANNPLASPIYLVKLNTANAQVVGNKDVTLTLPEVPGFSMFVKAGSVTFPNGQKSGQLSVTPVNASKIPMPPPNGMQPQFIVTIQPVGAQFDPPAPLSLPNVDGHPPGAQVEMYSYDHDLEEFVSIGLGTVSSDGSVIASNPGVGVIKAGWHCGSQPNGSGCASQPGNCQVCDGNCNISNLPNVPFQQGTCQSPKDCKSYQPDDSNKPTAQCKTCSNGSVANSPDQSGCNDGKVCTKNDVCTSGNCAGTPIPDISDSNTTYQWTGLQAIIDGVNALLTILDSPTQIPPFNISFNVDKSESCCESQGGAMLPVETDKGTISFPLVAKQFTPLIPPWSASRNVTILGHTIGITYGATFALDSAISGNLSKKIAQCDNQTCWSGSVAIQGNFTCGLIGEVPNPALPNECGPAKNEPCALVKASATDQIGLTFEGAVGCGAISGSLKQNGLQFQVQFVLAEGTWTELSLTQSWQLLQPSNLWSGSINLP
jgi:hypothetical protein